LHVVGILFSHITKLRIFTLTVSTYLRIIRENNGRYNL